MHARILRDLRAEKANLELHVLSKGVDNFETYKFNIGKIQGLDFAIKTIVAILGENHE